MARAPVAWLLNLDADEELAHRDGRYTPSRALLRAMAPAREAARALLAPGDVLVGEDGRLPPGLAGLPGRAFCPTPRARRALARAGAVPEPAPALEVLRLVNGRGFAARLGDTLEGARFVEDEGAAWAHLAGPCPTGTWLLKRAHGFAGRGRRKLRGAPGPADRAWLRASLALGGVMIEPLVTIELEVSRHAWLPVRGQYHGGPACVQRCDAHGAWTATRLAEPGELSTAELAALDAALVETAAALAAAGYFGPFGIDAFRYRDPATGAPCFRARSELNARYSMGWPVGMGTGGVAPSR